MSIIGKKKLTHLDEEIERVISEMESVNPGTEEYETLAKNLNLLFDSKSSDTKSRISKDAILTVGANLFGILMILNFERAHVATSKALSFILKPHI